MTWTYTNSPDNTTANGRRDSIRLLTRDTDISRQLLSDEEIAFALSFESNSLYRAASFLCRALADPTQTDRSIGDLSLGSATSTDYLALAKEYDRMADMRGAKPYAGGISEADKDVAEQDTDRPVPFFTRALQRDPDIGANERTT